MVYLPIQGGKFSRRTYEFSAIEHDRHVLPAREKAIGINKSFQRASLGGRFSFPAQRGV
jgi:hypothetical protein